MSETASPEPKKKRKSGIPTGNAGEYLVMGELLRRGFDAQLADRNTKGYDLLAGAHNNPVLKKVQVKTVRAQPWFVSRSSFEGGLLDQFTVYVLLGPEEGTKPVQFFVAKNRDLAEAPHYPQNWTDNGFINLKAIAKYENQWDALGR